VIQECFRGCEWVCINAHETACQQASLKPLVEEGYTSGHCYNMQDDFESLDGLVYWYNNVRFHESLDTKHYL